MKTASIFRSETPKQVRAPAGKGASRALMLDHYAQHLHTSTNRNGHPYAPGTIAGYMRCARLLATWLDDQNLPGDLTPACDPQTLNAFLRWYLEGHAQNGTSFIQRNLRNLFNWLERTEDVPSPFRSRDTDKYTARQHKPKTLTVPFIRDLLATCHSTSFTAVRDYAIIRLLLEGVRVGELRSIRPNDVPTLADPILRLVPDKGELRYADGSGRRILLEQETVKALQRYLRARADHPMADSHLAEHLWLGQGSTLPLSYGGIRLMLIRRSRKAGYDQEHATAHMFRHTFAHDFRANGGAIDDLVQHMGWQGPAMAYRYGKDMAEDRAIQAKRDLGPLY